MKRKGKSKHKNTVQGEGNQEAPLVKLVPIPPVPQSNSRTIVQTGKKPGSENAKSSEENTFTNEGTNLLGNKKLNRRYSFMGFFSERKSYGAIERSETKTFKFKPVKE
jgi:hypothetical protein